MFKDCVLKVVNSLVRSSFAKITESKLDPEIIIQVILKAFMNYKIAVLRQYFDKSLFKHISLFVVNQIGK